MMAIIFIILAAICNAIMDTISFHYYSSIFIRFNNPLFWNPEVSWKTKYFPHTKYKTDAWHISKSLMIIFLCCSIISSFILGIDIGNVYYYWYPLVLIGMGVCWNITFNIFYNKIFRL